MKTHPNIVIPEGAGARDFSVEQTIGQIGLMNRLAISGGPFTVLQKGQRPVGIRLPVGHGYAVHVFLDADDTYIVQRVYRGEVKGEERGIYFDTVGNDAYRASCYVNVEFGGHKR